MILSYPVFLAWKYSREIIFRIILYLYVNITIVINAFIIFCYLRQSFYRYNQKAIRYGVYDYLLKSEIRSKELNEVLTKIYEKVNANSKIKDLDIKDDTKDKVYSKAIQNAIKYIKENYKEQISLNNISNEVYLSSEYFSRLFKEEVGENFITYLTNYRMAKAEYLIKNTDMKISQISIIVLSYINIVYWVKTFGII